MLTRGAGAQFLLSVPHGACNFAVLETTRRLMAKGEEALFRGSLFFYLSTMIIITNKTLRPPFPSPSRRQMVSAHLQKRLR